MVSTKLKEARQRRILLVEDDLDLREALAEAMSDHGHEVVAVKNGRDALREMRASPPDVVVLDLMMPIMDGWQFRIEQKRDPALASTPVIAMSASHMPAAEAVDADLYLRKPLAARTLLQAIDDVLHTSERMREPAKLAQTDRMAALGTLAAGLAHEINNPLTYVLLHLSHAAQLLPRLATDAKNRELVATLEELVRGALEGGERIRAITGSIRSFSRIHDITCATLDVRVVLEAAVKLVASDLRQRATLTRDYGDVPLVLANEGSLGQVFLNLVTNAIQSIREGDVAGNEIRVAARTAEDGRALIEISDTGAGIAPHLIGRIFEPFFSTKPVGQGTGLGLSISHGIVHALGGEIAVTSTPGRGTTFRIWLPPARPITAPPIAPPSAPVARRVLVVDDEPSVRAAIHELLSREHEVVVASSVADALARIADDVDFDVILCDLQMPDAGGMALYERLLGARPELAARVVFMTGGAFTREGHHAVASGQVPTLAKPIDVDDLRALLAHPPA